MFFDWKLQLEKVQLTRDLSDNTMIYQEIRLPCKNDQGYCDPTTPTQATNEILVEYEKSFDMTTGKIKFDPYATGHSLNEGTSYIPVNFQKRTGQPGGKLKPHGSRSTPLQELSLMNNDIHLDMKLDYTISRIFQEMSLSELETLHQLCELERTQILHSLTLAVLKIPYAGYLL